MWFDPDWWNISVFFVIPILSVLFMFFVKRKLLWTVPLISTALAVVISIIAMPSLITYSEHCAMFFGIVIPIQLAIVIVLTVIAYFAAHILKQKQK